MSFFFISFSTQLRNMHSSIALNLKRKKNTKLTFFCSTKKLISSTFIEKPQKVCFDLAWSWISWKVHWNCVNRKPLLPLLPYFFYFIWDDVFYLRFYFIFFRQSILWSCRWHRNLFLVKCLHMFVPKWITSW